MQISRRAKKYLIWIVTVYLFLDIRPLLLVPNVILFFTSRNHFIDDGKCLQVNVFPKLNVGSDPVIAVFSEKNISDENITPEGIFGRTYDRSGLFPEFELSDTFNSGIVAETLYWLRSGIGGGLGGFREELPKNSRVYKGILINDYIHFTKVGLYDIQFKYSDFWNDHKYDLKRFFVTRLPENHIAKIVKSMFVRMLLKFPNDDVRGFAIKCLSYQENLLSTYILARYYFAQHREMEKDSNIYNNSTIEALTGIVRNQNVCVVNRVLRMFQKRDSDAFQELNYFYLDAHIERYLSGFYFEDWFEECFDGQEAEDHITHLIDQIYPSLDKKYKVELRDSLLSRREFLSDECLLFIIRGAKKSGRDEQKQHFIKEYNRKEDRKKIIRLIDFVYTRISEPSITASMIYPNDIKKDSVYIPENLEECFIELKKILTEEQLAELKDGKEDKITWHNFSVDVWMRSNWKLWSGSRLTEYFNEMGISYPRDMSRIILRSFHRHLHSRDIDLEQQVKSINERHKANE